MLKRDQPFSVAQNIEWTETNGEIVLIEMATERFFAFDETGSQIWLSAMSGALLNEIVGQITTVFEGDREKIEAEITTFLNSLIDQGWLTQERELAAR
jgi:hypothetical protein